MRYMIPWALFTLMLLSNHVSATDSDITVKEIIEADDRAQAVMEESRSTIENQREGESPLKSILALGEAFNNEDWQAAALYLDTRYLEPELTKTDPEELVRKLRIIWNQNQILDLAEVSNLPQGHSDDGLPSYRDLLGKIKVGNQTVPIYLQLVPNGSNGKIWKISNATVSKIPLLWQEYGYNPFIIKLSNYLPEFTFLAMQNWQVIGFIIMLIAAWIASSAFRWLTLQLISHSKTYGHTLHRFFSFPLRWFIFFKLLQLGVAELGLSLKARVYLNESALGYIATTFLVVAVIEFGSAMFLSNSRDDTYWSGIIRPVKTIIKCLAVITMALFWLADAGYDINTVLAGLGIGSLALALAAQKTLENVIGAITLYIAQPIRPGEFCKFGDISGVVEEIGLRSTRIRRLDRTVVHVPNSVMVAANLENVTETDRRHYNKQLRISLDTSIDQLRLTLLQLRELILSHPRVLDVAARVRFEEIERDAFLLSLNCYVDSSDINQYFAVAEDLNLHIVSLLDKLAVNLAVPEQKLMLTQQQQPEEDKKQQAKIAIEALMKENKLAFPDHTEEEKTELRDSIQYPQAGRSET